MSFTLFFKANAWRGVTADNFLAVVIFQKTTYEEQLLCYHLLLILKPCYNYHCICASLHVRSELGEKNYHFLKKCLLSVFLHISEKCVVTPSFLFGFQ